MRVETAEAINAISKKIFPKLARLRREFHQYPELAFHEFKTSERVTKELRKLRMPVKTGVAKTGVVGLLTGKKKGKTVALRADMDALPIEEKTNLPFKSKNKGVMHACGHDVHTACLIGAAAILSQLKDELNGNVKFIFQPSEEVLPGGAKPMIEAGVLEKPRVSGIFGLHIEPGIPSGKIGVKDGPFMAQVDDFDITIYGSSGHGARPHHGVDAIVVASQVILALQTIPARKIDPVEPVVVSVGKIEGGTARNIICDRVSLKGTARSLSREVARKIPSLMKSITAGVVKSAGASFEFQYFPGYPVLINHPRETDLARETVAKLFGRKALYEIKRPEMGAEDFSYFLRKLPGTFLRLGIRNTKKGAIYPWHHPKFTVDEDVIGMGTALLAGVAFDFLNR